MAVVGARPQFVKASVVSRALRRSESPIQEILVHTGQHYDENMSDVFFAELGIPPPDLHLGIGSASHGAMTGRMLEAIEAAIVERRPDWVLVYGDTNSTLAGSLAAAKLNVPVAHVEAGLRSFNRRMPEEVNRVLTDHASNLLFTPTEEADRNLRAEGIDPSICVRVGDVMMDVALEFARRARQESRILATLGLEGKPYVLATVHRAENADDPSRWSAIVGGLGLVSRETPVVWPVHPRTRARAAEAIADAPGVMAIDPVGYLDMAMLEMGAVAIATDSGGVQKEAFFHRVPCATLRDETEWVELVALGWNRLVPPTSPEAVARGVLSAVGTTGEEAAPYGDGRAAARIAEALASRSAAL